MEDDDFSSDEESVRMLKLHSDCVIVKLVD